MIIRAGTRLLSEFLLYVTQCNYWRVLIDNAGYGTAQQQLSQEVLGRFPLALPSAQEQEAMAASLKTEDAKFGRLRNAALEIMNSLIERRAALISAAVTGQIDVSTMGA